MRAGQFNLSLLRDDRVRVAFVLGLLVAASFGRTIGYGLYLDDYHLTRPWSASEMLRSFAGPFDTSGFNPIYFRPFAGVSMGMDWNVWGLHTWGFHITNLVLHWLAGCVVYLVVRHLTAQRWIAVAAAMLFVITPSNVATAVYVAERTDAMVAIWIGAAMLVVRNYHITRNARMLALLVVVYVLALLSKEAGLSLLPFAGAYWWYLCVQAQSPVERSFTGTTLLAAWKREISAWLRAAFAPAGRKAWLWVCGPLVATFVVYLAYRQAVLPPGSLSNRFDESNVNPLRALLQGTWGTMKGVPWEVRSRALPSLLVAIALAVVTAPRSRHWRVVALGLLWMLAGVLPLTFNGGTEPRLLYVAEIGMAAFVVGIISVLVDGANRRDRVGPQLSVMRAVLSAVALTFAVTTVVAMVEAQNEFRPGSDKRLAADLSVWNDSEKVKILLPEYLAEIRSQLLAAGLIQPTDKPGQGPAERVSPAP